MSSFPNFLQTTTWDDDGSGHFVLSLSDLLGQGNESILSYKSYDDSIPPTGVKVRNTWFSEQDPTNSYIFMNTVLAHVSSNVEPNLYLFVSNGSSSFFLRIDEPILDFQSKYFPTNDATMTFARTPTKYYLLKAMRLDMDLDEAILTLPVDVFPENATIEMIAEQFQRHIGRATDVSVEYLRPRMPRILALDGRRISLQSSLAPANILYEEDENVRLILSHSFISNNLPPHPYFIYISKSSPYVQTSVYFRKAEEVLAAQNDANADANVFLEDYPHISAEKVFLGMGRFNAPNIVGPAKWRDFARTILLEIEAPQQTASGLYMYLGDRAIFFPSDDPIEEFKFDVGNDGTALSYANTSGYSFLFQESDGEIKKVSRGVGANANRRSRGTLIPTRMADVETGFEDSLEIDGEEFSLTPSAPTFQRIPFNAANLQQGMAPVVAPAPTPVSTTTFLPSIMQVSDMAALPTFTPTDDQYTNGTNALMMDTLHDGDILAFIKSNNRVYDDKGIIVYTANGNATPALGGIFNVPFPRNPFTREPFRVPEDVVLKRVDASTKMAPGQKQCGPLGCSIMGGARRRQKRTRRRTVRSRRTRSRVRRN